MLIVSPAGRGFLPHTHTHTKKKKGGVLSMTLNYI